jgi:hypothetical protein
MKRYKIYLDGIELNTDPIGLNSFEVEVVREDGFSGSDQILREKTSTALQFVGDGYTYLCNQKKNNFCGIVEVSVDYLCGTEYQRLFDGIIQTIKIEFDLTRCVALTEIRDSSFTGRIKDYTKTELSLYFSRTKNCLGLSSVNKLILFGSTEVTSFDVLDTFQYFINFITDNEISVVSDYLTNNRLAITTGYNLHNATGSIIQVFPKLTFSKLFEEVRKKVRIFMAVEYDVYGNPYLRIEDENYFYTSDRLVSFADIPFGVIEKTDITRIFNSLEIGSRITELQDSETGFEDGYVPNPYEPTDFSRTWTPQTYTTCGSCTSESNSDQNRLDLVNEFIIDSDIIYEALNAIPTTDSENYANDANIFMFEYTALPDTANYTLDVPTGVYIYNANLINSTVIDNWFGYTPQCITLKNSTENYFLVQKPVSLITAGAVDNTCAQILYTGDSDYDSYGVGAVDIIFDNGNNILNDGITTHGFTFLCPLNGSYVFKQSTKIAYLGSNDTDPTYTPYFAIFDAGSVLVDIVYGTDYVPTGINELMNTEFTSPIITLFAGYTVRPGMSVCRDGTIDPFFDYYQLTDLKWELLQDVSSCDTTEDLLDSKHILLEFRTKLCFSDLMAIRANKKGYIEIANKSYWIKSIKWKETELAEFILIGNDSLCPC